jgi:hypothetical protein
MFMRVNLKCARRLRPPPRRRSGRTTPPRRSRRWIRASARSVAGATGGRVGCWASRISSQSRHSNRFWAVSQRPCQLPDLRVTHGALGFGVQPATCTRRLPSSMKKNTYSCCSHIVSTVKKSTESRLRRCTRTNLRHVMLPRVPVGPIRAARSQVRTVVADTAQPRPFSSPAMR